jgi:hypothetical protein
VNRDLEGFYARLLTCMKREEVRDGHWQLLDARAAWNGNGSCGRFIAYSWEKDAQRTLVAVNYSSDAAQCYLQLPYSDLAGKTVELRDQMDPTIAYSRNGDELIGNGLYLDVPPWRHHVFMVEGRSPIPLHS